MTRTCAGTASGWSRRVGSVPASLATAPCPPLLSLLGPPACRRLGCRAGHLGGGWLGGCLLYQ